MKRKLLVLLLALIGSMTSWAYDPYDFSVTDDNGQELYFKITSINGQLPRTVELTTRSIDEEGENYYNENSQRGIRDYNIPSNVTWNGHTYSVTAIGEEAFKNSDLRSITLPNSLLSIGDNAFANCYDLSSITIPDNVTIIGESAFLSCSSLASVTIGNHVSSIGRYAFYHCNMSSITIPNSVTTIGESAFALCYQLQNLVIGNSVTSIGSSAFSICSSLESITIEATTAPSMVGNVFSWCSVLSHIYVPCGTVAAYQAADGWSSFSNIIQDNGDCMPRYEYDLYYELNEANHTAEVFGSARDGRVLIRELGSIEDLIIPSSVEYNGSNYTVTSIGLRAFDNNNNIHTVSIPNTVVAIGNRAFQYSRNILSVTMDGVVSIGQSAFEQCGFSTISLPTTLTSIGDYAFHQSGLTSITIPESVTTIAGMAFGRCLSLSSVEFNARYCTRMGSENNPASSPVFYSCPNLSQITIGNAVEVIPAYAFYGCSGINSITIPNAVASIGDHAFDGCSNLTSVTFNAVNCTEMHPQTKLFLNCAQGSIVIGSGVRTIPPYAFYYCTNITDFVIPNTVTTIGTGAFYGCSNMTSITIPNSVTSIGSNAFATMERLSTVNYTGSLSEWCNIDFADFPANPVYFTHKLSINGTLVSGDVSITGTSEIKPWAFYGCTTITSVTVHNTIGRIGHHAFLGCTNLQSISTPAKTVGCANPTSDMPKTTSAIEYNAFAECSRLNNINLGNNLGSIGVGAFKGCSSLSSFDFPNTATTIEDSIFYGCSELTGFTIPNAITSIGTAAFEGCSRLTHILNLSQLPIAAGSESYGMVARYASAVAPTHHGSGENTLYHITGDVTDYNAKESMIPDNYIYSVDNGAHWKAKNIVLVDDTCRFFSPVAFTADNATYTRTFANNNRSTLYLPFTAAKSNCDDLEVYEFADYSNGTLSFRSLEGDNVNAYTPYLVGYGLTKDGSNICSIEQPNAVFPATAEDAGAVTKVGMTFHGTMKRTDDLSNNCYGYKDGYFVQSGGHAHVNPFRCYFTLSGSQSAPQTLSVDTDGDYLGIEDVDGDMEQTSIRYSNDVYDMMGRLVRKDAESLRGLPKGIYIWRGKKQIAF